MTKIQSNLKCQKRTTLASALKSSTQNSKNKRYVREFIPQVAHAVQGVQLQCMTHQGAPSQPLHLGKEYPA